MWVRARGRLAKVAARALWRVVLGVSAQISTEYASAFTLECIYSYKSAFELRRAEP